MSTEYYFSLDRMTHFLQYANALQEGDPTLWNATKDQTTEIFLQHIRSFIETCGVKAFKDIQVTHKKNQIIEPLVAKDPPIIETNLINEQLKLFKLQTEELKNSTIEEKPKQEPIVRKPLPTETQAKFNDQHLLKRKKDKYPIYERLRIIQVTGLEGTYSLADILSKTYNIRHLTQGISHQIAHLFRARHKTNAEKVFYFPPEENPTIKSQVYAYPAEDYENWIDSYIVMHCITPHYDTNQSLQSLSYIKKFNQRNTSEHRRMVKFFSNPRHRLTFEALRCKYPHLPYSINNNLL